MGEKAHHAQPIEPAQPDAHHAPKAANGERQTSSAEELERLKQEAKQAKDEYLRVLAEFENAKKRLHREKEEFVRYASETVVRELLPIVDSLDHALVAVDPSTPPPAGGVARDSAPRKAGDVPEAAGLRKPVDIQSVLKGIELIRRQLLGLLEKEGVKRIPTTGEPFDPHQHEAVAQVETSDGTADNTVVEEIQVGYTMHGKVIRPAMVKVAKKSVTRDKPQAASAEQEQHEDLTGGQHG